MDKDTDVSDKFVLLAGQSAATQMAETGGEARRNTGWMTS